MLAEGPAIVGYAVLATAAGEAHLLNVCVRAERRRTGCGRYLLEQMLDISRQSGAQRMYLEVRPSNAAARQLYESASFRVIARRPRYYQARDGREDALVLAFDLSAR